MLGKSSDNYFMLNIEYCKSCEAHNWFTHHDEQKYSSTFNKRKQFIQIQSVKEYLTKQYGKQIIIQGNVVPEELVTVKKQQNKYINVKTNKYVTFPVIGAFQVVFEDELLFSKKKSNTWPNFAEISDKIYEKLNGKTRQQAAGEEQRLHSADIDILTEKDNISLNNRSFLDHTDKRTTFQKQKNSIKYQKNFTLTDHFKNYHKNSNQQQNNYKLQQNSKQHLHTDNQNYTSNDNDNLSSEHSSFRTNSNDFLQFKKNFEEYGLKNKLPEYIRKKGYMHNNDLGKKQMIVKLDSIEEESMMIEENYKQNMGNAKNTTAQSFSKSAKKVQILQEFADQFDQLQAKLKNFQQKVQNIREQNKKFDSMPKINSKYIQNQTKSLNKKKVRQVEIPKNPLLEHLPEQQDFGQEQLLNNPIIFARRKLKNIQDYINGTEDQKNQKLKKIYGQWKMLKKPYKRKIKHFNYVSPYKINPRQTGYGAMGQINNLVKNSKHGLKNSKKIKVKKNAQIDSSDITSEQQQDQSQQLKNSKPLSSSSAGKLNFLRKLPKMSPTKINNSNSEGSLLGYNMTENRFFSKSREQFNQSQGNMNKKQKISKQNKRQTNHNSQLNKSKPNKQKDKGEQLSSFNQFNERQTTFAKLNSFDFNSENGENLNNKASKIQKNNRNYIRGALGKKFSDQNSKQGQIQIQTQTKQFEQKENKRSNKLMKRSKADGFQIKNGRSLKKKMQDKFQQGIKDEFVQCSDDEIKNTKKLNTNQKNSKKNSNQGQNSDQLSLSQNGQTDHLGLHNKGVTFEQSQNFEQLQKSSRKFEQSRLLDGRTKKIYSKIKDDENDGQDQMTKRKYTGLNQDDDGFKQNDIRMDNQENNENYNENDNNTNVELISPRNEKKNNAKNKSQMQNNQQSQTKNSKKEKLPQNMKKTGKQDKRLSKQNKGLIIFEKRKNNFTDFDQNQSNLQHQQDRQHNQQDEQNQQPCYLTKEEQNSVIQDQSDQNSEQNQLNHKDIKDIKGSDGQSNASDEQNDQNNGKQNLQGEHNNNRMGENQNNISLENHQNFIEKKRKKKNNQQSQLNQVRIPSSTQNQDNIQNKKKGQYIKKSKKKKPNNTQQKGQSQQLENEKSKQQQSQNQQLQNDQGSQSGQAKQGHRNNVKKKKVDNQNEKNQQNQLNQGDSNDHKNNNIGIKNISQQKHDKIDYIKEQGLKNQQSKQQKGSKQQDQNTNSDIPFNQTPHDNKNKIIKVHSSHHTIDEQSNQLDENERKQSDNIQQENRDKNITNQFENNNKINQQQKVKISEQQQQLNDQKSVQQQSIDTTNAKKKQKLKEQLQDKQLNTNSKQTVIDNNDKNEQKLNHLYQKSKQEQSSQVEDNHNVNEQNDNKTGHENGQKYTQQLQQTTNPHIKQSKDVCFQFNGQNKSSLLQEELNERQQTQEQGQIINNNNDNLGINIENINQNNHLNKDIQNNINNDKLINNKNDNLGNIIKNNNKNDTFSNNIQNSSNNKNSNNINNNNKLDTQNQLKTVEQQQNTQNKNSPKKPYQPDHINQLNESENIKQRSFKSQLPILSQQLQKSNLSQSAYKQNQSFVYSSQIYGLGEQTNQRNIRAPILKQIYGPMIQKQNCIFLRMKDKNEFNECILNVNQKEKQIISIRQLYGQIGKPVQLFNPKSIQPELISMNHPIPELMKLIQIISQINEFLIVRLFENPFCKLEQSQNNNANAYAMWLCIDHEWRCIVVNDEILMQKNKINQASSSTLKPCNYRPYYLQHEGNQIWPSILEKCLVVGLGGYEKLLKTPCYKLFSILTGSNSLFFNIKEDPTKNQCILRFISDCENKNFIIHAQKVLKNLEQLSVREKQAKVYYVLSQKQVNDGEILIQMRSNCKDKSIWVKLGRFVQEFRSIQVLQMRINHNFTHIQVDKPVNINNLTIIQLQFIEQSFGSITLSCQVNTNLRAYLYKQQKSNVLKLVGEAKQKNKQSLFFDCFFKETKYYLFVDCQQPSRVVYLGENRPSLRLIEQVNSQGFKNDYTQYLPIKNSSVKSIKQMPRTINKNKFNQTSMSFKSQRQEDKISRLRENFVDYLLQSKSK